VGGGVHGAAIARAAAARGLRVVLVERRDFGHGTSSRSSKLAHGGLRYLEHLQLGLVRESLRERNLLLRAAPHLCWPLPFLVPLSGPTPRAGWKIRVGLSVYDFLAGRSSVARHRVVSAAEAEAMAPALVGSGLREAALYHDAGMDDQRIVVELVIDAAALGATCVNHAEVTGLIREAGIVIGARIRHEGTERDVCATVTVLACGPWTDAVAGPRPDGSPHLTLTRGSHLFFRKPLVASAALMLASPDDGRIFFIIPWRGGSLLGTTDTPLHGAADDARPTHDDVRYLLDAVSGALPQAHLRPEDVVAAQCGVRPLVAADDAESPSSVSRDWQLDDETPGLLVVLGGKYTIFRKLAERVTDRVAQVVTAMAPDRAVDPEPATPRPLPGAVADFAAFREREIPRLLALGVHAASAAHLVGRYGARTQRVLDAAAGDEGMLRPACDDHPHVPAEAVLAVTGELARTPEDALLRRLDLGWSACGGLRCMLRWRDALLRAGLPAPQMDEGLRSFEDALAREWRPPGGAR
jgi:glycerol-3-phosphate dehydrogenase